MPDSVTIELSPAAKAILEEKGAPRVMLSAMARAMDQQNQLAIGHISEARMSGKGPFPPAEHRLGVVTNRLRSSLRASKTQINDNGLLSAIGSNVKYAGIHEFGGVIHHKARSGSVRLRVTRSGELQRQPNFPFLAVFARSRHKRVKEVTFQAAAYDIHMPKRAPIFTGIQDRQKQYGEAISTAIETSLQD